MCKIGEVVVVGGVRRSAMISLSNLSDDRMRHAKSGAWWEANVQRALSNNSAVYTEKPDVGQFMSEWLSLYESKSGERGIFSRDASQRVAKKNGRRDPNYEFGTNPCSEIILRPYQFCNLTEVVIRSTDNERDLARKVRIATILGTFQSTLTYFPYLRKVWQKNTEEERLLGVSLTGIYDNPLMNDYNDSELPARLEKLRQVSIDTNKEWSDKLGINQSVAITCVKPSGTVSQLVLSPSGIHPGHDRYFYRRVRSDNKDPLTKHLIDAGVPHEPDVTKPHSTTVFTFPMKLPETSITRENVSAISHLELWLMYQRYWCEHKPSVTINVNEEEWPRVGAWVYDHFDEVSGISFLPYDGGSYRQAPYETITKEEYEKTIINIPTTVDWDNLIEMDDNVEGVQTLACSAGNCEI
jgi:ribonucleoside-diphosphate reductase alpha chain